MGDCTEPQHQGMDEAGRDPWRPLLGLPQAWSAQDHIAQDCVQIECLHGRRCHNLSRVPQLIALLQTPALALVNVLDFTRLLSLFFFLRLTEDIVRTLH